MKNIKEFLNLLYHRYCWLSESILQNPNIFNNYRETLAFVPPGDENLTQYSCSIPVQMSYFEYQLIAVTSSKFILTVIFKKLSAGKVHTPIQVSSQNIKLIHFEM